MKDGREKVGECSLLSGATGAQFVPAKNRRLALPFGPEETEERDVRDTRHEHNIREIGLGSGGLGCALWDGGLVLTRWVYEHGGLFAGASVLELGCGVGLAGIMAAHWADSVVLTDYIQETVDNALYNAELNSCDEREGAGIEADGEGGEEEAGPVLDVVSGAPYRRNIKHRVSARVLDWDRVAAEEPAQSPSSSGPEAPANQLDNEEDEVCTTEKHGTLLVTQPWVHCRTCWPRDRGSGCCLPCARRCHRGHDISPEAPVGPERFRCDCRKFLRSDCCARPPLPPLEPVDVIIGAELTYNLLSCSTLAVVVDRFLKPDGVFYEVLSDDRDGVGVFIAEIERRGFVTRKHPAPRHLVGQFGTRKWSKQDTETYSLYSWRRASHEGPSRQRFPDMQ